MITYQDLIEKTTETDKMALIEQAIREHQASEQYKLATIAEKYFNHENPTIEMYEKYIFDTLGKTKDIISPNHKIEGDLYFFFITQLSQYLLSNGVFFDDDKIKKKISNLDNALSTLSINAQNHGVSFGFVNVKNSKTKIEPFSLLEFVPLYDEENGTIRAGARFWQLASDKPLRITFFEEDGVTEYIKKKGEATQILVEKRKYLRDVNVSETGIEILEGRNYPKLPIVPFYNIRKQSSLKGNRGAIDGYDLVASKMVNNISEGDLIYWIINNCGGMDLVDDQEFLDRIRKYRTVHADEGTVEAKSIEIPHEATDSALIQLRKILFDSFMAFDPTEISAGNVTATQITSAYQKLDDKADLFEFKVIDFVEGIFSLIGIENATPSFKRNRIANMVEESEMVLSATTVIGEEMTIKKLPFLTPDEAEGVIQKRIADELKMVAMGGAEEIVEAGEE